MDIDPNFSGKNLEEFIENLLFKKGYKYVSKGKFMAACSLNQSFFTKQFDLCKSIYGGRIHCDFVIYSPDKHPDFLAIESKWQQSPGSVDEKFPYLVENIKKRYPYKTIIVIDGGGYKSKALEWIKNQIDNKLIGVFGMVDFQSLVNKGFV